MERNKHDSPHPKTDISNVDESCFNSVCFVQAVRKWWEHRADVRKEIRAWKLLSDSTAGEGCLWDVQVSRDRKTHINYFFMVTCQPVWKPRSQSIISESGMKVVTLVSVSALMIKTTVFNQRPVCICLLLRLFIMYDTSLQYHNMIWAKWDTENFTEFSDQF